MKWSRYEQQRDTYYIIKEFNGYKYRVVVYVEKTDKSIKYWFGASSGKKRKEFDIFEDKNNKSLGGIKALFWIKECIFDFPIFYGEIRDLSNLNQYLCIQWVDNRRRDIYSRLQKEGFQFMQISREKILIKKLL